MLDGLQPPCEYVRCRLSALDFAVTLADRPGLFASFALSRRTKPPPYITQAHRHIKPCIKANITHQLFPLEITFNNSTDTISCEGLLVAVPFSRFRISGKLPLDSPAQSFYVPCPVGPMTAFFWVTTLHRETDFRFIRNSLKLLKNSVPTSQERNFIFIVKMKYITEI